MANSFGGNQQEVVRTRQPDHPQKGEDYFPKVERNSVKQAVHNIKESNSRHWVVSKVEGSACNTQYWGIPPGIKHLRAY